MGDPRVPGPGRLPAGRDRSSSRRTARLRPAVDRLEDRLTPSSGSAPGLPIEALYAVSESLGRADVSYAAQAARGAYALDNAVNGYAATVAAEGFRIGSGADAWSLSVRGVGYGDDIRPLGPGAATVEANRVAYDQGAVSQWFVNGPLGLQQGFTLDARPEGSPADGPLTIALAVGGLIPTALPGGTSVALARADGTPVATYGGLIAYDAEGRAIPAAMTVDATPGGPTVAIRVDDADAVYPLVVDPYVQSSSVTADLPGGGCQIAVSADGSTMAVGVPLSGLVLIYEKSADGWAETGRIQRSEPAYRSRFGASVALSADGSTFVAGGREDAPTMSQDEYSVYTRGVDGWADPTHTTLTAPADLTFGTAAAVDASGRTIAVTGFAVGPDGWPSLRSILIYRAGAEGWALASRIASPDIGGGFDSDGPIALDDAGENLVVGGPTSRLEDGSDARVAFFFRLDPVDGWSWAGKATMPAPEQAILFGDSVAISGDGRTALVGGAFGPGSPREAAPIQVYTRFGGYWARTGELAVDVDPNSTEGIAGRVALNEDGTVAVAATTNLTSPTHRAGSVYVFVRRGDDWHVESRLDSPNDPAVDDHFGAALAARGGFLYVGASRYGSVAGGEGTIKVDSYAFAPSPLILDQPTNVRVIAGRTATFTAAAADPGLSARWDASRDGGATWSAAEGTSSTATVAGHTQSWLTVDAVAANSGMLVRVVVTDPGSGESAVGAPAALVVVEPAISFSTYISRNPLPYGTVGATITVRVASTDALTTIPDGGVLTLSLGDYYSEDRTIEGGLATFWISPTMPVGSHFLGLYYQAREGGEIVVDNVSEMLVVTRAGATATLEAPIEAAQGDPVSLAAVISPSSSLATARGGVIFLDGGRPIAFEQTTAAGGRVVATFSSRGLAAGDHYLQLVYLGDPTTSAASSGVYRVTIRPTGSSVAGGLAAPLAGTAPAASGAGGGAGGPWSPSPAAPSAEGRVVRGESVTFAADVQGTYASVRWQYADGEAWVDIHGASRPWYTRTASLDDSGRLFRAMLVDEHGATTTSGPYSIEVVPDSVSIDVYMRPMTVGQETGILAHFRSSDPGRPPTGSVRASFGDWAVWAPLVDGWVNWIVKVPMTAATHEVRIDYGPTFDHFPAVSATLHQIVTRDASLLTVAAPRTAGEGDLVSLVVRVATTLLDRPPTGGVMVLDGGRPIALVPVVDAGDGTSSSIATFATRNLAVGDHYFQFVYLGDPWNTMASTRVYKLTIQPEAAVRATAAASTSASRPAGVTLAIAAPPPSSGPGAGGRAAKPAVAIAGRLAALARPRSRVAHVAWSGMRTRPVASWPGGTDLQR
ncbi:Ig-like domain-containing protein [Paludisphaera mucosa]|uniref:Ig-like domain-containing protein n=1 Tax=Paludisphaera mucosa TaxID=3030827 RepID=A0ABT6FEV8_9BACT|nr:Ig-like domain-containing protein [Paludisphaera mucosa]MDG3006113.1 Ig-like domain-containing protein [Paludisphaera mucosa]